MKKIIITCVTILIVYSTISPTFAASSIDFRLSNAECSTNRLVDIEVIANGSQSLCAATFELSYDKDMLEFRDAKSDDSNSVVKSNETDGKIKVVYLCSEGANISGGKTIFTVTFKAVKTGTGRIDFNVYECVDNNIEFLQIGSCTPAKVTVNGSTQNDENANDNSLKSDDSESSDKTENKSSSKTQSSEIQPTTSQSTIYDLGTVNPINDNKNNYILLGILIGLGVAAILASVFFIGRKTANNKNSNNK